MDSDNVGYKKPPQHSRFQKGVSGNPKGRPKGTRNFEKVFLEILHEEIAIKENGKVRRVTKLEAILTKLINKAASGDLNAARLLIAHVRSIDERPVGPSTKELSDEDVKIIKLVLREQDLCPKGEPNNDQ